MFPSTALLSFVVAALSLGASATPFAREAPKFNLAFATRVNTTGFSSIVAADQARAKHLKTKGSKRDASVAVTNTAVTYVANVGVGSPATQYSLLIDTGSSNTWLGADKAYKKTSTSKSTGASVSVSYGSGSFSGKEYTDTVTLGSSLVITGQSIGVASTASGFDGVDGILGIGPTDLTEGTLSKGGSIPTVIDNLLSQGTVDTATIGIFYAPPTSDSDANGQLTFGGVDEDKITTDIAYVPVTSTSPASDYWGIDQTVKYGTTTILSSTAGIVDTGTTLVLLATDAFKAYQKATGATLDNNTGLLKITSSQFSALKNLNFDIGGETYALTPNAQIWPRSLNADIGGSSNAIYLVVADLGSDSGEGLDFIDGYTFLERFYSVFDTTNSQVGFAKTSFTTSTSN